MLSSKNFFHHTQISHEIFEGLLTENVCVGGVPQFPHVVFIFSGFQQKNADRNLSSFSFLAI